MKLIHRWKRIARRHDHRYFAVRLSIGYALFGLVLAGCAPVARLGGTPDSLAPKGAAAREIAALWWLMAALGTAVFLAVVGLMVYAAYTNRRTDRGDAPELLRDPPDGRTWIWIGGVIVPAAILAIIYFFNLRAHTALAGTPDAAGIQIEVTGHQWWWEVRYANEDFTTANQIHIPVGAPVVIHLRTEDVIHSFWVPELAGKMDLIPGQDNRITIQADEAGIYRGICAEFCGRQHARMQLLVVVQPQGEYDAWLERERQPAASPENETIRSGQQVFLGSSCVYCHTVRGTNATATIGPDLTHIASRLTLAAGTLENTPGNLTGWIIDPQHIKPGNLMPPSNLNGAELQLMLAYLQSLE